MRSYVSAKESGALFVSVVAERDNPMEIFSIVKADMVRGVVADIDADFSHDLHGIGVEPVRIGSGGNGFDLFGEIMVSDAVDRLGVDAGIQ